MKKILTLSVACLALVFSSAAIAQDGQKNLEGKNKGQIGQQLGQKRETLQKLLQSLNLSEEQKAKVKEILKKSREDIQAVMKGEGERKEKAEKVRAIRKETQDAIRNVLNDEQKKKFDEWANRSKDRTPLRKKKS